MPESGRLRTCVACKRKQPQSRLNRLVLRDGQLVPDGSCCLLGRGAYVCSSIGCLLAATKRGGLSRALRAWVEPVETEALARTVMRDLERAIKVRSWNPVGAEKEGPAKMRREALKERLSLWMGELEKVES